MYIRNCPKCNVELKTENKYFYNKCVKNNSTCLSCSLKGKPKSENHKLNMSKNHADFTGDKNPFYKKSHTDESKKIMREANIGMDRFSEKMKLIISKRNTGEGNPFFGKTHSIETVKMLKEPKSLSHKINLSKSMKGRQSYFQDRKHSDETKRKMRISAIKRLQESFGKNVFRPNVNKKETEYFKLLESKMGWNGIYHGKNENKIQFHLEDLGYFVDFYDKENNIVVEYDETNHYDKNWSLKPKDVKRQNEIKEHLKCKFYRYIEPLDKFYEV